MSIFTVPVILLLATLPVSQQREMTFERALHLIERGIEALGADHREGWEASYELLQISRSDSDRIAPYREMIVAEIQKLDRWDSFTELTGSYKLNLIKSLFGLADPSLAELFIHQCQHGTFAAKGLARIGAPAVPLLLQDLGEHSTCRLAALASIAESWLGPDSPASDGQRTELQTQYRKVVIPAIRDRIEKLEEMAGREPEAGSRLSGEKARETLARLEAILSSSR